MTPSDDLPADLRDTVAALVERSNVCHLVSLADVTDVLPARRIGSVEAERLLAALADSGLHVIEPDAAARLTDAP